MEESKDSKHNNDTPDSPVNNRWEGLKLLKEPRYILGDPPPGVKKEIDKEELMKTIDALIARMRELEGHKEQNEASIRNLTAEIEQNEACIKNQAAEIEQNDACIRNQAAEIEHLKHELEISKEDVSNLSDLYEEAQEDCKKAQIQLELCQSLLKEKGPKSEFTVREIAIIALALFRKGGVVPKNKKNIAKLFSKMLGVSANTLSVNLCSTYSDEEILELTNRIKDDLPEFADYLSENKIETEIKK